MTQLQPSQMKEAAARYAVAHTITDGMNVGLGTGTTAAFAVTALAERVKSEGLKLGTLISTSDETRRLAAEHGLEIGYDLTAEIGWLDVTIDGADEVDPYFNLIKGGGGALLREKLVADRTRREVIIVDDSKLSAALGTNFMLPVMIVPYAWETTAARVADACGLPGPLHVRVAKTGETFLSDDTLYCLDVPTGPIPDPPAAEARLKAITGVVDVGLFCGMAQTLIVAFPDGRVEMSERGS